ncbi:hypothetical protein M0813_14885 [Anaeramoeba flamelloides]|uniref:Uncharacterized protein n=1 Tax=Anaeramoeba flamelloides TaxID=1746091 RepID=A0AAV7Z7Q2_9EUKA|nr:hypothetical protein M0812_19129 [Anaeramoeba flamelloides]KAJ6251686.1 hypothetical protein M0813_14885 [Anaeramoeba flamelloides]
MNTNNNSFQVNKSAHFTSPLTEERNKKINQFMNATDCKLADSIHYLWFSDWDLQLAIATQVLCKLCRLKTKLKKNPQLDRSHSAVQPSTFNLYNRKRLLPQSKSISCPNVVEAFQLNERKKRKKKSKTNIKRALTLKEMQGNDTTTKELMKKFLNQKPAPRWKARLTAFDEFDSNLIKGWPSCLRQFNGYDENNNKIRKLIIHKKLFQIYLQLNRTVSIKNLQRGLITFMEKQNFLNLSKYDDPVYLFVSYEPPTF